MDHFEALLAEHHTAVERFIKFHIPSGMDADDVLQDVYLTAYRKFGQLKNIDAFKPWLISIARNKCNDWFREKTKYMEIPLDAILTKNLSYNRYGRNEVSAVLDTLALLGDKDKQILYLYYWKELPQTEIANRLCIPLGTVKSRLHTAKENFKKQYPYPPRYPGDIVKSSDQQNGDINMNNTFNNLNNASAKTKLPEKMPTYTIERSSEAPFSVKWEELMGWMIVPKPGEKLSWGLYDCPSGVRNEFTTMEVIGKAEVHGIEGVEIVAVQHDAENYYRTGSINEIERRFVAQLTDTHCRYLAETHVEDGIRKCYTFLDGDSFINNWGFGEDNCGSETNLSAKGLLKRNGNCITGEMKLENLDVVGRYTVTINGESYDTICVMDIECFNDAVASEQYIDQNGRTVLWRRFNRNDWAFHRYQQKWTEMLPANERLLINGEVYVHWYDCISDYIL